MKFNEKILGWGIIVFILGTWILSYKFSWIIYILYMFILICGILFLINEISSFRKSNRSEKIKLIIEVPYYWHLIWLLNILNIVMHMDRATTIELVIDVFLIIIGIIDLPINYKNNSRINIYENGILLSKNNFLVKRIVPYIEIEKLNFIEYEKGKFLFDIKLKQSSIWESYKYKIKERDKEKIILFIKDYIDKEKIIETREYEEDTLW